MEKLKIKYILFFLLTLSQTGFSEDKITKTILINGTKFTYPLIEKWAAEYMKNRPDIQVKIVRKPTEADQINIRVIAYNPAQNEFAENKKLFFVGKYALLPITSNSNPLLAKFHKKGLDKDDLEKLYFEDDIYTESKAKPVKPIITPVIYAREGQACSARAFSDYFGHKSSELKGKKISGDDSYLLTAVKKDSLGISYNIPANIYDLNSRKIKVGLAVLPVNLKKESNDVFTSDLDQVLGLFERTKFETVPVEKIGFVFTEDGNSAEISEFLKWVVTEGQKYNHDLGFLTLEKEIVTAQLKQLDTKYIASK